MKTAAANLKDFADWLSPMLVKELRQGTRTRIFATAFIALQAVLALTLLVSAGSGDAVGGIFWWILTITLFIAMPLRGFAALSAEEKLRTMDLIILTRLTAWRIAFGKWAALMSQSVLLVVAVLPYVVLRYFLGGVNVFQEIAWLGILLFISAFFTALTVGFSAHQLFLTRGAAALGVLFLGTLLSGGFYGEFFSKGELPFQNESEAVLIYGASFLIGLYAIYFLLEMGAGIIAPDAENHATRKRLATLGVISVCVAALFFEADPDFILGIMAIVTGVAAFDALTETPRLIPSVIAPFTRFGIAGQVAGRLLYPGWHSGLFFTIILAGIFWLSWDAAESGLDDMQTHTFVSIAGALIFPLAIIQLFFRGASNIFTIYILIQCVVAVYALILSIIATASVDEAFLAGAFLPLVCLFAGMEYRGPDEFYMAASMISTGLCVIILLIRTLPVFRRTWQLEQAIRAEQKSQAAAAESIPAGGSSASSSSSSSS